MIFERQEYQQNCIKNIITLLENFDFESHSLESLKKCFQDFYATHPQPLHTQSERKNIDILMETGTGKTFTYLNTIFELHRHYFQNKFVIFLPRKAILESLKQNIKLTKDYFFQAYNKHLKAYFYNDEKSINGIINGFIKNTDELSVLILTNSSIDKGGDGSKGSKKNILRRQNENLFDNKTILEYIIELKPICFIDEPHLLKGEKFDEVFQSFQTLYFRFGATFPKEDKHKLSNMVYCLDSISAFNQYLVKQINVHTINQDATTPKLISWDSKAKRATFSYVLDNITHKASVRIGENLGEKLHYCQWGNKEILRGTKQDVILNDGDTITLSSKAYELDEEQIKCLINKALDLHFDKEEGLFKKGIKALCLFFIPHISDFRGENPRIKTIFEELYITKRNQILSNPNLSESYREYLMKDFDSSHKLCVAEGYFSGDRGNSEEKEAQGVKLILEEKEKLLSLKTPLRFIFSVWALQEGWDNPNVFTLIKLASSTSETSRHQQVGRGLRLALNQEGKRINYPYCDEDENLFYEINALDVLISGNEGLFIEELQKEIEDTSFSFNQKKLSKASLMEQLHYTREQAEDFIYYLRKTAQALHINDEESEEYECLKPIDSVLKEHKKFFLEMLGAKLYNTSLVYFATTTNKHTQMSDANQAKPKVKIKKEQARVFLELWQTINQKAKIIYKDLQTQALVNAITQSFHQEEITPTKTTIISKRYDSHTNKITLTKEEEFSNQVSFNHSLMMKNLLEFAKNEKLPLGFLLHIYQKLDKDKISQNPKQAFEILKKIIQDEIHRNILSSVSYDFMQTNISSKDLLYYPDGMPKDEILCHHLGKYFSNETPQDHYLYDKVIYDSLIEKDAITQDPKKANQMKIKVFAKLPKFAIPTPYKHYEPDFAYLIEAEDGSKIFFICETKGYESKQDIPLKEQKKIDYAKKFFASLQKALGDQIQIQYEVRINKQSLTNLLTKITHHHTIKESK